MLAYARKIVAFVAISGVVAAVHNSTSYSECSANPEYPALPALKYGAPSNDRVKVRGNYAISYDRYAF